MDAVYFTCQPCLLRSDTFYWQRLLLAKKKENYRNKSSSRFCRTYKYTNRWHGCKHKRVHSFFSQGSQQTHYYHTQTKSHTPRCGKTTHTSAGQCLPEDQRELWMLTSRATLHVCGSPQNTSHCCPSFWLPSMTPLPQTSQHPHIATSPQPDGFFFFFNCLWALAPLLYHTKSLRWLGGVEGLELCVDKWFGGSRANKTD